MSTLKGMNVSAIPVSFLLCDAMHNTMKVVPQIVILVIVVNMNNDFGDYALYWKIGIYGCI